MPEYLSPGVYVEEVDAGPKPIEGVSTSTAGAVGVTVRGPTSGKPVMVTSFADFSRRFGGVMREPKAAVQNRWDFVGEGGRWWRFALSVRGFFDNGGQRLFVKRVFSSKAKAAKADLQPGLVLNLIEDAAKAAPSVKVGTAIGIRQKMDVFLVRGDTGATDGPFAVASYDEATGVVALGASTTPSAPPFSGLPRELSRGRDYLQLAPVSPGTSLTFTARDLGAWGGLTTSGGGAAPRGLYVRSRPIVGNTFNLLNAPGQGPPVSTRTTAEAPKSDTNVPVDDVAGFSADDRVRIADQTYVLASVDIAGKKLVLVGNGVVDTVPEGAAVTRVREAAPALFEAKFVSANPALNTITVDDVSGISSGATVLINDSLHKVSNPDPVNKTFDVVPPMQVAPAPNDSVVVRPNQVDVWGGRGLYEGAIVEIDNGTHKERRTVGAVQDDTVTLTGPGGTVGGLAHDYWEGHKLRVIEAEVVVEYRELEQVVEAEAFTNLRLVDDGSLSYIVNHINASSRLVRVAAGTDYSESDLEKFPTTPHGTWLAFADGEDALDDLAIDDFIGTDGGAGKRTGIVALEDIDEVSLCMAPNMWSPSIHGALMNHCEILKDRFAILDPRNRRTLQEIQDDRAPMDTKYAALYYPWLRVRDPLARTNVDLAPSGHMAGIYARVDNERGFHKAPANEVVRGIDLRQGFAQDITRREQDLLNPKGINALRFFPGRGHRVWGARTLTSDSAWKYVNVRRIFIMIEESIDEGTQWVVFEPNDHRLWSRVRQTVSNFLTTQWRNGVLQGRSAEEAFFVKCDESTMTQDDIDNGRLICDIGIAPVKPAEFVIFRIQQKTIELQ